jgi:hypothetical protein
MYQYRSLTKAQLVELVGVLEDQLMPAINQAKEAASRYSPDSSISRYPFEVGYLSGIIKTAIATINDYKECSK